MKNFIRSQSILTGIVLFILFAGLTILFGTTFNNVREQTKENLLLHRDNIESEVALFFNVFEVELNDTANYIKLGNHYEEDHLLEHLMSLADYSPALFSIYFLGIDGRYVNSSGFQPPAELDLTTRPWYQMAIQTDGIVYTPGYLNASKDAIIVTLGLAVYQDNEFLGVLAADIITNDINDYVRSLQIGDNGYALIIDQNGNMLAHPGEFSQTLELLHVSEISNRLDSLDEREFIQDVVVGEDSGVIAQKMIRNSTYKVIVFLPDEEFRSSLTFLSSLFVVLVLIFLMMEAGLLVINQKMIIQPLITLEQDIGGLDINRDLSYRLPEEGISGFHEIRSAVNRVLDKNEEFFKESQKFYHELMIENQRFLMIVESTADIIFEVDTEKRFVSVYGKGLDKIQRIQSDFIGKTVLEVFGDAGKARDHMYTRALAGDNMIYDWDIQVDGEHYFFESSIAPIYDEKRQIIGAVGVTRDITESKKKQAEIEYISIHDFLTGLHNRRYYGEMLEKFNHRDYYPLGIVMVDLNGLKIINDAFGHEYGDSALKQVANALRATFKHEDIICRIGGDEFSMIVPKTSVSELEEYKAQVRKILSSAKIQNLPISVAFGYDIKQDETNTIEETIKLAENDMYRKKLSEGMSIRNHAIQAILKTLTEKYEEERIHSEKVAALCKALGMQIGISDENLKELEIAGMYHDIGKISIPDAILNKPGRLTDEEYEVIKTHTEAGYQILKAADQYSNLAEYALSHHERWDGKGYPRQISGEQIPLFSRIIALADSYEAMTADRPYRTKMTKEEAVKEIIRHAGLQFDPTLARIFVEKVLKAKWREERSS